MEEAGVDYVYQSVFEITHSKGTLPIIGVTKENHVLDAVKAANSTLTKEETEEMEKTADSLGLNVIRFWEKEMK